MSSRKHWSYQCQWNLKSDAVVDDEAHAEDARRVLGIRHFRAEVESEVPIIIDLLVSKVNKLSPLHFYKGLQY